MNGEDFERLVNPFDQENPKTALRFAIQTITLASPTTLACPLNAKPIRFSSVLSSPQFESREPLTQIDLSYNDKSLLEMCLDYFR